MPCSPKTLATLHPFRTLIMSICAWCSTSRQYESLMHSAGVSKMLSHQPTSKMVSALDNAGSTCLCFLKRPHTIHTKTTNLIAGFNITNISKKARPWNNSLERCISQGLACPPHNHSLANRRRLMCCSMIRHHIQPPAPMHITQMPPIVPSDCLRLSISALL